MRWTVAWRALPLLALAGAIVPTRAATPGQRSARKSLSVAQAHAKAAAARLGAFVDAAASSRGVGVSELCAQRLRLPPSAHWIVPQAASGWGGIPGDSQEIPGASWSANASILPAWLSPGSVLCAASATAHHLDRGASADPLGAPPRWLADRRRGPYWLGRLASSLASPAPTGFERVARAMLGEAPRQPATAADRVLGTGDEAPPATVGQVLGVSGADMQALRMLARSRCRVELGGGRAGRAHRGGGSTGADACGVLDGWLWLGPWSAGKLEVEADPVGDSGGDGLFGGSAPGAGILGPGFARGDALYASPSEVVEGGAKWRVAASAPSAQRPADSLAFADGAGGLEAAPAARALAAEAGAEGAAWNALVQGVGTAAVLEVQGWAVSSLSLPEAATLVVACSGPTAVWLVRPAAEAGGGGWDRALPLAADVYGGGWASWSGRLPAGPYELVSRLRGRARASLACSVRAFRRQADAPALAAERSGLVSAPDAVRVDPEWGPEASSSAVLAGAWVGARLAVGARPVALVASEARVTADGAGAGGLGQWSSGRVVWGAAAPLDAPAGPGCAPGVVAVKTGQGRGGRGHVCAVGAVHLGAGQAAVLPVPLSEEASGALAAMPGPWEGAGGGHASTAAAEAEAAREPGAAAVIALPEGVCPPGAPAARLQVSLLGVLAPSLGAAEPAEPVLVAELAAVVRCRTAGEAATTSFRLATAAGGAALTATVVLPLPPAAPDRRGGQCGAGSPGGEPAWAAAAAAGTGRDTADLAGESPFAAGPPLLVSLHGTGVSAASQADAFKAGRRLGSMRAAAALSERLGGVPAPSVADAGGFEFGVPAWVVVAPERRGAHNWEGPHGQGTVSAAVAAVPLLLGRLSEAARRLVGAGAAAQSTSGLAGASAGAGALDWEGVCRDRGALAAVGRWWPCQPTPDGQRVLWAGHSMGGHGAWVALSRGAGRAVCAWPGAGWLSKEAYSDANLLLGPVDAAAAHWGRSDGGLRGVLHSCVVGNDAEANAADVAAGVPTVVRTGADDATVPPLFSRRGARAAGAAQARRAASLAALVRAGAAAVAPPAVSSAWLRLEQIPGKGHWFWDTRSPNDGGVLADCASRAFMAACASRPSDAAGVRAWQAAADGALSAQGNPATARPASPATCAPPQAGERRVLDEAWVAGVFSVSVGDDQEAEGRRGLAIARRGTAGGVAVATVGVSVSACGGAGDSAERGPVVWTLLSHGNVAALRLDTTVLCAAGRPAALVQRARLLPNSSSAWQRVTPGPSQAGLLSAAVSRLAGELGLAGVPAAELAEPWAEFAPPSVVRDASGRELWSAEQSGVCSRDPDRPLRAVRVSVQFPPAARDRGRAGGPFAGTGLDAESAEVQPMGGVRPAAAAPRRPWPASFARDVWRRPVTIVVGSRCQLRNGTEQACHEDEMTQRNALAAFVASHGALAADAHVSIVADAVPGLAESQVRRGDAVIAVGGAGSNLWLRRAAEPHAGANASAVIPAGLCGLARRCSESLAATGGSGSQGAVLSVGFVDAGATRSPLLVLDSVGAVDAARGSLAWSLHAVLAAPTVPPMTRAPWTNAVPGLLLAGPRLLAEGDAAFLAAGVWEQTGDSSSLDAAASAVMRC